MKFLQQPKAVFLLCFVQLWNQFSHFGMRALLVLYMVRVLGFSDATAFGVFAAFCALDKLGGLFGTFMAERFFGLKKAILLGGWIIALGHVSLACGFFWGGLSLLILGSSLFTTNIIGFVGHFYQEADPKRTSGYTLFYMGINIGAFFATILCGFLAEKYGWEYGFGLAAFGMMIANLALLKSGHLLKGKGDCVHAISLPKKVFAAAALCAVGLLSFLAISKQGFSLALLPWIAGGAILFFVRKKNVRSSKLGIYLIAYIIFIAAGESQIGSSLLLFSDRISSYPTGVLLSVNPLVIICLGAVASRVFLKLRHLSLQILVPFFITALGYLWIFGKGSLLLSVGLISFAEILVCPIAYSVCSQVSARVNDPKIMTLIPLSFAFASALGGGISKWMTAIGYEKGFFFLALLLLAIGSGLAMLGRIQNKIYIK